MITSRPNDYEFKGIVFTQKTESDVADMLTAGWELVHIQDGTTHRCNIVEDGEDKGINVGYAINYIAFFKRKK